MSADEIDDTDYRDDVENNQCNQQQRRLLPLREAANELTQLRLVRIECNRDLIFLSPMLCHSGHHKYIAFVMILCTIKILK